MQLYYIGNDGRPYQIALPLLQIPVMQNLQLCTLRDVFRSYDIVWVVI